MATCFEPAAELGTLIEQSWSVIPNVLRMFGSLFNSKGVSQKVGQQATMQKTKTGPTLMPVKQLRLELLANSGLYILHMVSSVSGMGSTRPHCTWFHPNGFHPVSPETFIRIGFKWLRFI